MFKLIGELIKGFNYFQFKSCIKDELYINIYNKRDLTKNIYNSVIRNYNPSWCANK